MDEELAKVRDDEPTAAVANLLPVTVAAVRSMVEWTRQIRGKYYDEEASKR